MIRHLARRGLFAIDRLIGGGGRGLILLYHRVADESSDPYGLCVSPSDFTEHLEVVRNVGHPLALTDMAEELAKGDLPDRAIAVSFDDAYIDVLKNAMPLLTEFEVPATVFVTVGPGGREREFWWDELERVFFRTPRLPPVLRLAIGGRDRTWELGPDAERDPERWAGGRAWHLLDEEVPTRRHGVFRELYHLLRPLPEEARTGLMDRLLSWAGDGAATVRPTHRVMSPAEVAELTSSGLVRAGAHTVSHPDLRALPLTARREEVRRSKTELEDWVGEEVHGFAYPYGLYDEDSVSEVRQAGFAFACAGDHHAVRSHSDPLLLPRLEVPGVDGSGLADLLRRFLG